jgi:hypothetical protein
VSAPANDLCADAEAITCGQTVSGSTCFSTNVGETGLPTSCGAFTSVGTRGGNWYRLTGDGRSYTAYTCNNGTNFDTKLHVFSGSCGSFVCETNNDDVSGCASGSFRSSVTFATTCGTDYYILVNGFSTAVGNYEMTLTCECPTLTLTGSVTQNVNCFGDASGSITATASGSCDYTYNLTGNMNASNNTGVFTGLTAGIYTVQATTAGGACSSNVETYEVTQPDAPLSGSLSVPSLVSCGYNISCNGGCIEVTSSVAGGTAPYSYSWDDGATTANDPCAHAGNRTLTVTDANGCTLTLDVTLTEPDELVVTLTSPEDQCGYNVSSCCNTGNGGSGSGHHGSEGHHGSGDNHRNSGGHGSSRGHGHGHGGSGSGNLGNDCGQDGVVNSATTGGCAPYTNAWSNGATTSDL